MKIRISSLEKKFPEIVTLADDIVLLSKSDRVRPESIATAVPLKVELPPVVVNIGGKDFKIKGDADELSLRGVANFVDGKIKEIKEATGVVDLQNLSVLAALNIAEELYNLRKEKATDAAQAQETAGRLEELERLVDSYLKRGEG